MCFLLNFIFDTSVFYGSYSMILVNMEVIFKEEKTYIYMQFAYIYMAKMLDEILIACI